MIQHCLPPLSKPSGFMDKGQKASLIILLFPYLGDFDDFLGFIALLLQFCQDFCIFASGYFLLTAHDPQESAVGYANGGMQIVLIQYR